MGANPPPGKEVFGKVKNTDLVVTQEVDSVFQSWTNNNTVAFKANTTNFWIGGTKLSDILLGAGHETDPVFNTFKQNSMSISIGKNSEAWNKGVAIGIPFYTGSGNFLVDIEAGTGERYYWRSDYFGNV